MDESHFVGGTKHHNDSRDNERNWYQIHSDVDCKLHVLVLAFIKQNNEKTG